jgi:hypothetical protein
MRRVTFSLCLLFASMAAAAGPAGAVARLREPKTANAAWKDILALGQQAVPELQKLLADPDQEVQARAAALLYRLGKADALDKLSALLGSESLGARREAAAALLAYVGEPAAFRADAPADERQAGLAAWKTWWAANRDTAMTMKVMKRLYGKVVAVDEKGELIAISLLDRHGAKAGMRVAVRRGGQAVCSLEIVLPTSTAGSVARIAEMSAIGQPQPGDLFFSIAQ